MAIHAPLLDALEPSAIRGITAQIRDKRSAGSSVVNFAGGMPDEAFFPYMEFAEITAEILQREGGSTLQYAASDGYDPLRRTIAQLMTRFRVATDYKNILITCGSQQALSYLSRALLSEGDTVFCEAPSYVGALDTFRTQNVKIVGIEMDEQGMRTDALENALAACKPRFIYTIPDFQNPTGRRMSLDRRRLLVELAERYDTYIVEDAPYSLISFDGTLYPAVKSFDHGNRVFYLGSFSKTICPGIRVGWLVADTQTLQQLIYLKMRDDLQVSNLSQRQTDLYLRKYDFNAHLAHMCILYRRRRDCMLQAVRESFPPGTQIVMPEGGIFLWLSLPKQLDALRAFDAVFAEDLAFVPGTFFFPDRSGKHTMRLNFCTNSESVIGSEIRRMGRLLCDLCDAEVKA